ncbi:hypothetical protein I3842_12G030400 [Carya illinoinensis]|uniref:Pentatricopeptide repeat-containing protein n=1 Tax=Carya illinoinensis TaxID=32201 RepID=A0A922DG57_CARIL|nr:hypothetical protein I3842_12G030400 [Carya illinoinensis]
MNRAKASLTSLRLLSSLLSIGSPATRLLASQVIHFSRSISHPSFYSSHFLCPHQKLFFSSKSNTVADHLLANDWSDEFERELEKLNQPLTHETVIYIFNKKLDKDPEKASGFFNWVCEKTGFRPSYSVYSVMLRILVNKRSMKQFWITLRKMKEHGFYVDKDTYLRILGQLKKAKMPGDAAALSHFYNSMRVENARENFVKKVVHIVLESEWSDEVELELGELKILLCNNFMIRIFKELRNYPSKALKFFHWAGHCNGYEHNTMSYNAIARVLGREDSIEMFWSVVEEMKNVGHEMDFNTYIKISRQFLKNKMMEDAVKLYEFMMDGPFKPSVQDCGMLLRSISAGDNPNLDLVFRVAKNYESTGHTLSKAVYDGIHRSLTNAGRFDEAENIMKVMRNAGYPPDNITYSQVVFGLCKAGRFEEACKVLDDMEAQGCLPDIKTWTILIQGLCAANEVEMALMCLAKMIERNYEVDADLLDVILNGFLTQKKIDGAYKWLVGMVKESRVRPWQATYKYMIENLFSVRKLEEALNLLHLMKKQNYPPFPEPFVQYISKFGTVENALEYLKALSVKEYPSSSAYLHVFKSFFQEGRHSEAKDLLCKCPHHIRTHGEIAELFSSTGNSNVIS